MDRMSRLSRAAQDAFEAHRIHVVASLLASLAARGEPAVVAYQPQPLDRAPSHLVFEDGQTVTLRVGPTARGGGAHVRIGHFGQHHRASRREPKGGHDYHALAGLVIALLAEVRNKAACLARREESAATMRPAPEVEMLTGRELRALVRRINAWHGVAMTSPVRITAEHGVVELKLGRCLTPEQASRLLGVCAEMGLTSPAVVEEGSA